MDIRADFNAKKITKVFDGELSIIVQSIIDTNHEKEFDEAFKTYTVDFNRPRVMLIAKSNIIEWLMEKRYWKTIKLIAEKMSKADKGVQENENF